MKSGRPGSLDCRRQPIIRPARIKPSKRSSVLRLRVTAVTFCGPFMETTLDDDAAFFELRDDENHRIRPLQPMNNDPSRTWRSETRWQAVQSPANRIVPLLRAMKQILLILLSVVPVFAARSQDKSIPVREADNWQLVRTVSNPSGGTMFYVIIPEAKERDIE